MQAKTSGITGYTIENRDVKLASQSDTLFVPPADYKKAGNIINWRQEKQKLDAGKN
jgi:hypothetical protein